MTDRELSDRVYAQMELDDKPFSPWEMDFITQMSLLVGSGRLLSPRQRGKLQEIYEEKVK